jgi:hypothetical protein
MFVKVGAIFYAMAGQIHAGDEFVDCRTRHSSDVVMDQDNEEKRKDLSFDDCSTSSEFNQGVRPAKKRSDDMYQKTYARGYLDKNPYTVNAPTSCREIDTDVPPFTPGVPGLISPCPPKRNR